MATTEYQDSDAPSLETPIEVPEVHSPPDPFEVVAFADFLLTNLLRHGNGVLHGEFKSGVGRWFLRTPRDSEDAEIARQEEIGYFRMVLARFGYWYTAVQLYGGSAQRVLIQRGQWHDCEILMSNDNRFGYSLRVCARLRAT